MFEKFKKANVDKDSVKKSLEQQNENAAKRETENEVRYSGFTFTDKEGRSRNFSEHPKFNQVVEKIHELDRIYNNVDEAKKKLMGEVAKRKFGFIVGIPTLVGGVAELIRNVDSVGMDTVIPALLAVLTGVLSIAYAETRGDSINKAKEKHGEALHERVSFITKDELKDKNKQ